MPLIVQRKYQLGVGSVIDSDAPASSASLAVVPSASDERVTTRTCHRWSYVDASSHETCIITLHAHYSLHVDVKGAGTTDATSSPQQVDDHAERPNSDDGLCGFSWEFIWIPSPRTFAGTATAAASPTPVSSDTNGIAHPDVPLPVRARFFFPRTTPLARSTVQGTGGVLFLNSRHVLVATEVPVAADSVKGPTATLMRGTDHVIRNGACYGLMDSFVLSSSNTAALGSASHPNLWTRIAAATALPGRFAARQAPGCSSATSTQSSPLPVLLLVTGVPLPPQQRQQLLNGTAAAAEVPLMRLVYVFSVPCTSKGGGCAHSGQLAWDVLVCVADLCSASASADNHHQLFAQLRHSLTLPQIRLSVQEASTENGLPSNGGVTQWGHVLCGVDGASRTLSSPPPPLGPQRLSPCDLLWVFVEEKDARGVHLLRDGQLCGSLVALLPCSRAPAHAWEALSLPAATAASSQETSLVPSPPAVLSMGFKNDTPYGALMVSSIELDSYARVNPRQRRPSRAWGGDLIKQLLPSPERVVYQLVIGKVTECVSPSATVTSRRTAAASPTVLPAHTSLVVLIMDGIHTRDCRGHSDAQQANASQVASAPTTSAAATAPLPQGLYLTETLPWDALARLASPVSPRKPVKELGATVHVHRVPLARTLWCELDPLVLSASTSTAGIPNGDWGDEGGAMQDTAQAARIDGFSWDVGRWMEWLSEVAGGDVDVKIGSDHHAALLVSDSATEAECIITSALAPSTATVTAVPSCLCTLSSPSPAVTAVRGFPRFNDLTQELTMLWCCCTAATGHSDHERHEAAAERAVAHFPPPVSPPQTTVDSQEEWEAEVAEWVAAEQVRGLLRSSTTSPNDAAVAAATYRAMRMLWAYAVLSETGPALPQWPRVFIEAVHDTATDAAAHQTRLHVYASAVQTVMTAHLASNCEGDTATVDIEVRQMRRAAGVFLRLVLRTLVELDWCAGDTLGWVCCQWTVRWFLGSGASFVVPAARPTDSPSPTVTVEASIAQDQAAAVEGLAMQVLLQLGAAVRTPAKTAPESLSASPPLPPLDWLRRVLLLFACRNRQLPLELTIDDILAASGVPLHPERSPEALQATSVNGWGEDSDEEVATSTMPPWPTHDTAELRESMEYALLRLVKPEELYSAVHHLARASPALSLQRVPASTSSAHDRSLRGVQQVLVRGVLTVADLHALLCTGWASGQPPYAAPPGGFAFVCCTVDVAMMFTSTVSPIEARTVAVAEAYEQLVIAALDTWGGRGGHDCGQPAQEVASPAETPTVAADAKDQAPVYPLFKPPELDGLGNAEATTEVSTPFPFTVLPPLLTVYFWYHVMNRLCAALQLLPLTTSETTKAREPGKEEEGDIADEQEHTPWLQRAKLRDGAELQALHRGVCVLRCLTQEDATSAEELFAAMRLVYSTPLPFSRSQHAHWQGQSAGTAACDSPAATASPRNVSWVSLYLASWDDLLLLEAPPLCSAGALLAYQDRRYNVTAQHVGDPMRVLHLLYSSAGSNRALRAQLWRIISVQQPAITRSVSVGDYMDSYEAFTRTLWCWRLALQKQHHCGSMTPRISATTMHDDYATMSAATAAWLAQVWVNVLLCDPEAVTNAGMYGNLFTALVHVRQRSEQTSIAAVAAADVAFALLRPCLLYALPILEQLSVKEELMRSNHPSQGKPASFPSYPQYNESLAWSTRPRGTTGELQHRRAPARLGAKEVCERVREQLRCLVALYEVSPSVSTDTSSSRRSDVRFTTLVQLMALQPTVASLAAAQRRIAQHSMKQSAIRREAAGNVEPGSPSPVTVASSIEDVVSGDEDSESSLEVRSFFLPPAAMYVIAATAAALHHTKNRTNSEQGDEASTDLGSRQPLFTASSSSSSLSHQDQQQQQSVGWLVVACEVVRRELGCHILAELQMNGYVEEAAAVPMAEVDMEETPGGAAADAGLHPCCFPTPCWRLVTSEAQLKEFINALADAVVPLTGALVKAFSLSLIQPIILLLVLDVLHTLLQKSGNKKQKCETGDAAGEALPCRAEAKPTSTRVSIGTDASTLGLLRQWIRRVAEPLYQQMTDADKQVVLHIITGDFAHDYLTLPHSGASPVSKSYRDSSTHAEWRQWRKRRNEEVTPRCGKKEVAMLECLRACVVGAHKPLVQMTLPRLREYEAPKPAVAATAAAAALGSSWMDPGSALRTSLLTVGAVLAPRPAHRHQQQHAQASSSALSLPRVETGACRDSSVTTSLPSPKPPLHAAPAEVSGVSGGASRSLGLTVASSDELQLLLKEETFKRRQCTELLLREQQLLLASPVFQRSLLQMYLALRLEKRRRELVAYALGQYDLIFSFSFRWHLLRLNAAREEVRRAWCEWGERQRTARQRLLQEERDARVGVQAIAYAARSLLLDAERQERCVWMLYEEGRAGLMAFEEDAWDALATAAAHARVELTKRAAEAAEEAYWKEEEAAWERIYEEELLGTNQSPRQGSPAAKTKLAQPPPMLSMEREAPRENDCMSSSLCASSRPSQSRLSNRPMNHPTAAAAPSHSIVELGVRGQVIDSVKCAAALNRIRQGAQEGLGSGATVLAPAHASCDSLGEREASNAVAPAPGTAGVTAIVSAAVEYHQQQQRAPFQSSSLAARLTQSEDKEDMAPGWDGRLAKAAVSTAGGLFNALSQWQSALRDTVAPPPPTRDSGTAKNGERSGFGAAADRTTGEAFDNLATTEAASQRAPVVVTGTTTSRGAPDQADDWDWSSNSDTASHPVEGKPAVCTAREEETSANQVVALHPCQMIPLRGKVASVVGETSAAAAATTKPPRKKKGFAAAAVRIEPISSALTHVAPPTSSPPSPPAERHLSFSEDVATPNPARSILSAVEAAAAEIPSKPPVKPPPVKKQGHESLQIQPQGSTALPTAHSGWSESSKTSSSRSSSKHDATSPPCEPCAQVLTAAVAQEACGEAEAQVGKEVQSAASVDGEDAWEWSDAEDGVGMGVRMCAGTAKWAIEIANATHGRHESHGCTLQAEPSSLPAAATVEKSPQPNVRLRDDDWGWSDDDRGNHVPTDEKHTPPLPSPPRVGNGVISTRSAPPPPPPSAQLPNFSSSDVKGGWSSDDGPSDNDTAIAGFTKAPNVVVSTPLNPPEAATRRNILADYQEMYAAELEIRAKMVKLL
ncbi:hypothetical protein JKF63_06148 [Porcisia hertigi]|uniref:Uncharacterized protein n=1 Tax=Porcisia hertigi TaxID=2761500 RepID=A0A836IGM6_9TRYP|nr:hypothetical protein JKF63_06148 [Porcisia hertigi]